MKILSTKRLTDSQRKLIASFEVEEVSMIDISFGENFKIEEPIKNAVFTSANSVRSVFKIHQNKVDWFTHVFCVGNKTQYLLKKYGVKVETIANNAIELADKLADRFSKDKSDLREISWFCGNLRNNDLPNIMAENDVLVTEYMVYQTILNAQVIKTDFDAILFFSPSGVKSYLQKNNTNNKPVICIGSTTATEAVNHFEQVYVADETSVESVIEKVKIVLSS